ncbi:MAG: segregation/condensation protein A [Desulfatiglans sp.]|jgi:segregation and condensation protein A|nr:segregation/condensation protein A [Thermodesulfobacteriota bacterium]MEE4353733.1 segregation/condensation protein A [Desulfatiglans sp.]
MVYEIKLEIFEGPLDLLLHLINKNEVDIFDIPIATIADQYLEYIEMMKVLNINVAGDFLLMASTLVHLKSKMLLPESNDDTVDEDLHNEIVRPLLEYMSYREIAGDLSERDLLERDVFCRQVPLDFRSHIKEEGAPLDVNLFQLIDAFKQVMDRTLPGVQLQLRLEQWSVKEKIEHIITCLKEKGTMLFVQLFVEDRVVSEYIVTFLALLELVHMGLVRIFQSTPHSDIKLTPCFEED